MGLGPGIRDGVHCACAVAHGTGLCRPGAGLAQLRWKDNGPLAILPRRATLTANVSSQTLFTRPARGMETTVLIPANAGLTIGAGAPLDTTSLCKSSVGHVFRMLQLKEPTATRILRAWKPLNACIIRGSCNQKRQCQSEPQRIRHSESIRSSSLGMLETAAGLLLKSHPGRNEMLRSSSLLGESKLQGRLKHITSPRPLFIGQYTELTMTATASTCHLSLHQRSLRIRKTRVFDQNFL